MTKKSQQKKVRQVGEVSEFEDLVAFEQYLKEECEDDHLAHAHAHIIYFPPFVLAESHNDPEKIKDSQNRKNKKFVRHLHQHVEKHLLKEIESCSGLELNWGKAETSEDFDTISWKYVDHQVHDGNYHVEVVVKCNSEGAAVDVHYDAVPANEEH